MTNRQTLRESVRSLNPEALRVFKRQLLTMPASERQRLFSQLSGIPELADITGTPSTLTTEQKRRDTPLWMKALSAVGAPFRLVEEKAIKPAVAVATGLYTPPIPGTEGMNWFQREQAEYKAWKAPWGVKGTLEFLPWLAIPGAGSIAGRLGGLATKQAGTSLGRAAAQAQKIIKPVATAERIITYPVAKPLELGLRQVVKAVKGMERLPGAATTELGFAKGVGKGRGKPVVPVPEATVAEAVVPGRIPLEGLAEQYGGRTEKSLDWVKAYERTRLAPLTKVVKEDINKAVIPSDKLMRFYASHAAGKPDVALLNEFEEFLLRKMRYITANTQKAVYGKRAIPDKWFETITHPQTKTAQYTEQWETLSDRWVAFRRAKTASEKVIAFDNFIGTVHGIGRVAGWFIEGGGKTLDNIRNIPNLTKLPFIGKIIPPTAIEPPVGGVPPVKPPPGLLSVDEADDFWKEISGDKAITAEASRQRDIAANRAATAEEITTKLGELPPEEVTLANYNEIVAKASRSQRDFTKMGFSQEFVDSGVRTIRAALVGESEFEVKATITAFVNAIEGKGVPRKLGVKGGSAYTRLAKVFGPKTAEILASPKKLQEAAWGPAKPMDLTWGTQGEIQLLRPAQRLLFEKPLTPADRAAKARSAKIFKGMERRAAERAALVSIPPAKFEEAVVDSLLTMPVEKAGQQILLFPQATREKVVSKLELLKENVPDALNILRATLSSVDISGIGRQAGTAAARHPVFAFKVIRPMIRAMFDPQLAETAHKVILSDPVMHKFLRPSLSSNIYLGPLPSEITQLALKEESFMSNIAMKIPVLGSVIRGSARAFVTGLNLMRWHMAHDADKILTKAVGEIADMDTAYSEMARLINYSTGRGDLKLLGMDFNRQGGFLNTIFFSPRLFFSRFQWPAMVGSPVKEVRVEAWKQIGTFLGAIGSILAAFKLSGRGGVELDPRSSDFGKLNVEGVRLDLWAGYAQYLRLFAQLTTTEAKTESGFIKPLRRWEVIDRFGRSKYSPAVGLLRDMLQGQSFLGEEFPAKTPAGLLDQIYERAAPLAIQDMVDGFLQSGTLGLIAASPGLLGVGVATYTDTVGKEREKAAKKKFGMSWDEVGQTYGEVAQLKLEQTTPSIIEETKKREEQFDMGVPTTMGAWRREGKAIEETYRDAIVKASQEFRDTQDGSRFQDKVNEISAYRRISYASRAKRKEYRDITDFYSQPLSPNYAASLSVADIVRREFYKTMFSTDEMYDQYGNYRFDEADRREQAFLVKHGQAALDYIEEYQGARWLGKPPELQALEQAREVLRPYWDIAKQVWAQMPPGLQAVSDQIQIMERTDPQQARQTLRGYPQIVWAREQIARLKKQLRLSNPAINQAYATFYKG